jgi:hypothetical protein
MTGMLEKWITTGAELNQIECQLLYLIATKSTEEHGSINALIAIFGSSGKFVGW